MLFVNIQIKKQTKVNLLQEIIRISNYMGFLERPTTHLQWDITSIQYRLLPSDYPPILEAAIPTIYILYPTELTLLNALVRAWVYWQQTKPAVTVI